VVQCRRFKPKKSYADAVRNQHKLYGVNRVSIRGQDFQSSKPVKTKSAFDRITWPRKLNRNWGSRLVNRPPYSPGTDEEQR
jgi:hypothetical protein